MQYEREDGCLEMPHQGHFPGGGKRSMKGWKARGTDLSGSCSENKSRVVQKSIHHLAVLDTVRIRDAHGVQEHGRISGPSKGRGSKTMTSHAKSRGRPCRCWAMTGRHRYPLTR